MNTHPDEGRTPPRRQEPAVVHGGNGEAVCRAHGIPADALLDFSASINPDGPPARARARLVTEASDTRLLTQYPDADARELRSALAAHVGVEPDHIVVANGSSALIGACIRAVAAQSCLLPVPAFGEYRRALDAAGCAVSTCRLEPEAGFRIDVDALCRELHAHRPALCILTNPHNPSGALIPQPGLRRLMQLTRELSCVLLVDEAFVDFVPEESLVGQVGCSDRLMVLRSMTKFYGMPALRVGYAVSSSSLATRIERQLPPWPVSRLAAAATVEALRDVDYATHVRDTVARERTWMVGALRDIGLQPYPSAANFVLIALPDAWPDSTAVQQRLIASDRILVRDCRSFEGIETVRYIRVSVRSRADNCVLIKALASLQKETG